MTNTALAAALEGREVILVAPTHDQARAIFERMVTERPDLRYQKAKGLEAIYTDAGGVVTFASARALDALRGRRADDIIVTDPALLEGPLARDAAIVLLSSARPSLGVLLWIGGKA